MFDEGLTIPKATLKKITCPWVGYHGPWTEDAGFLNKSLTEKDRIDTVAYLLGDTVRPGKELS